MDSGRNPVYLGTRRTLPKTVVPEPLVDVALAVVVLGVSEKEDAMRTILFVSGKEAYAHQLVDDLVGRETVESLEWTEAVELCLAGVTERREPYAERRRPHWLGDPQDAVMAS